MRSIRFLAAIMALGLLTLSLPAQEKLRRLNQEEAVKAAISKPQPDYPPVARQLKLQGRVEAEVSITAAGTVDDVKVLTGNAALTGAVVNALRRWRFEPITADGKPVRAIAVVSFTFKL